MHCGVGLNGTDDRKYLIFQCTLLTITTFLISIALKSIWRPDLTLRGDFKI